jgi:hypothetical protein
MVDEALIHFKLVPHWLVQAVATLQSTLPRVVPSSNPRHDLQRPVDMVLFLMHAAYRDRSDDCDLCSWTTENDIMLNDILHHIERLDDPAGCRTLSDRHNDFTKLLFQTSHCAWQNLFATKLRFVGWVARPVIGHSMVPRGASMPWVLRKTDVDGEYKLIIDCFVHGIMEGELMALVESGQLQTQTFTLV